MSGVIVVGGGPSGMMAAIAASERGARVTLLERNEKLGKKLYITGKGRCNVTNNCSPEDFQKNVVKNPRFLFSALRALPPASLMERLERMGCPLMVERGARVFPESEKASDVTRALAHELARLGVTVTLGARVSDILTEGGAVSGVTIKGGGSLSADSVILCTGGASYSSTGSTGDGYRLLTELSHQVYPPLPALSPIVCERGWVTRLMGLSLKNVRLTLSKGGKTLFTDIGEMLFTHFGISGPLALTASSYLTELDPSECELCLDLKPGLDERQLDARILRQIAASGRTELRTMLQTLFPARLSDVMAELADLNARDMACLMTRENRGRLIALTKRLPLPIKEVCPLDCAIITRGGINVKQVNPSTMESRLIKGLYVCGELLDADALTGGYNLHIAFCTGYLAGSSAAKEKSVTGCDT